MGADPASSRIFVVTPERELKTVAYLDELSGEIVIDIEANKYHELGR